MPPGGERRESEVPQGAIYLLPRVPACDVHTVAKRTQATLGKISLSATT